MFMDWKPVRIVCCNSPLLLTNGLFDIIWVTGVIIGFIKDPALQNSRSKNIMSGLVLSVNHTYIKCILFQNDKFSGLVFCYFVQF